MSEQMSRRSLATSVTIAASGTKTAAVRNEEFALGGFTTPATFTGTAITFEVSLDNSTFVPLYHEGGAALSITVTTSKAYPLPPEVLAFPYFKLVSGSTEGAERTIGLSFKS